MTYGRRRFVVQQLLNLFHNLGGQLGQNVDSSQVLNQLLRFGRPEDDTARIGVNPGHPRESELSHATFQFCKPQVNHRPCACKAFSLFSHTSLGNFGQLFDLKDLFLTFLREEVLHQGTPIILVHRKTRVFGNPVVVLYHIDKNKDPQVGTPKSKSP